MPIVTSAVRRSTLCVLSVSMFLLVPLIVEAGPASARLASQTWSAQWVQANPGDPLVLILNPRAAEVCFVGLDGPQGVQPVGWRFQPGGHRLSLTLLTRTGAAAGSWRLSALCQRRGVRGRTTSVTISVPSPGGSGVLAAHGDMRVQFLPGRAG